MKVAIRDLVEFVLLSGDIRAGFTGSGRAVAGTRGHQMIQKSRPPGYTAEVAISQEYATPRGTLELTGRIDGVWVREDGVTLEEIKTTTRPLAEITRDNQPLHWGQARVYAFLYAREKGLAAIDIQLTYLQIDSQEILEFRDRFTLEELETFVAGLVAEYLEWAGTIREWQAARNASIAALAFPFSAYRAGQRDFAVAVYRSIRDRTHLFAQAPTGLGKTMATVFPALKTLGEGLVEKIFYLTARTVGRGVAEEALCRLAERGLRCKILTLTAKEKICFLEKPDCRPEACEFAKGHFDRVKEALKAIFTHDRFDRAAIEKHARTHRVCPFEFSLFLALWADLVICDYNYVFDPRVFLRRFFDPPSGEFAFLIDEAHNMPDRAREMFSADVRKSEFVRLRGMLKTVSPSLARAIGTITPLFARALENEAEEPGNPAARAATRDDGLVQISTHWKADCRRESPAKLLGALSRFARKAEAFLVAEEPSAARESLLELFFRVSAFLRTADIFDESFVRYAETCEAPRETGGGRRKRRPAPDIRIRLFCVDPSPHLREALERARSAVFFSATLQPISYFFHLLGGRKQDHKLTLASPFPAGNLGLVVIPQVRTEFRVRERSFAGIADIVHAAVSARKGNYLVSFPSFRYLESVREIFAEKYREWRIIWQRPGMPEEDREEFLRAFAADNPETLVGFVVMGGIFGEGIDLRGERLIGSIIVGVGLPQICLERDLVRQGFREDGFEIAYRFPGMNRVMQAAGRVIRTERDRGVVLLVDDRFTHAGYRRLFPREWAHAVTLAGPPGDTLGLQALLDKFWKK